MNGLDMLLLGHKLIEIGQDAIPRSGFHALTTSARTVLVDVFKHPDSSIGEITGRTGFPQSLVSGVVAKFREQGVMDTKADPRDRRRTLVRAAPGRAELGWQIADTATVDATLAQALRMAPGEVAEIVAVLESLAVRLFDVPSD